jgi:hypothetical protein
VRRAAAVAVFFLFAVLPEFSGASLEPQASSKPSTRAPASSPIQGTGASSPGTKPGASSVHSITITFDYDFAKTPPCAPKQTPGKCVRQFNVYNLTEDGHRQKLFSIPLPNVTKGLVRGITGTGPRMAFSPGEHKIAVSAVSARGAESTLDVYSMMVTIPPESSPDPFAPTAEPASESPSKSP